MIWLWRWRRMGATTDGAGEGSIMVTHFPVQRTEELLWRNHDICHRMMERRSGPEKGTVNNVQRVNASALCGDHISLNIVSIVFLYTHTCESMSETRLGNSYSRDNVCIKRHFWRFREKVRGSLLEIRNYDCSLMILIWFLVSIDTNRPLKSIFCDNHIREPQAKLFISMGKLMLFLKTAPSQNGHFSLECYWILLNPLDPTGIMKIH